MTPDDARDLAIHAAIDHLVTKTAETNNWSRRDVFDRIECFTEAEEEEQKASALLNLALAANPRRKRGAEAGV
ncbi:MAG TPA: hypothetical protein VM915_15325 [Verrucomicrobiae bacterium]|nr:hypothetical protein [Verrucomicrobiae bacterium]